MFLRTYTHTLHNLLPFSCLFSSFFTAVGLWEAERRWTHARSHLGFFFFFAKLQAAPSFQPKTHKTQNSFPVLIFSFSSIFATFVPQALIRTIAFEIPFALGETENRLEKRMIAVVFREAASEVAEHTADILLIPSALHLGGGPRQPITCLHLLHQLTSRPPSLTSVPPLSSSCRPRARQLWAHRRPPDPVLNLNVLIALQTPLLATPSLSARPIICYLAHHTCRFFSSHCNLPACALPRLFSTL